MKISRRMGGRKSASCRETRPSRSYIRHPPGFEMYAEQLNDEVLAAIARIIAEARGADAGSDPTAAAIEAIAAIVVHAARHVAAQMPVGRMPPVVIS